jgi:hypothetical protein
MLKTKLTLCALALVSTHSYCSDSSDSNSRPSSSSSSRSSSSSSSSSSSDNTTDDESDTDENDHMTRRNGIPKQRKNYVTKEDHKATITSIRRLHGTHVAVAALVCGATGYYLGSHKPLERTSTICLGLAAAYAVLVIGSYNKTIFQLINTNDNTCNTYGILLRKIMKRDELQLELFRKIVDAETERNRAQEALRALRQPEPPPAYTALPLEHLLQDRLLEHRNSSESPLPALQRSRSSTPTGNAINEN